MEYEQDENQAGGLMDRLRESPRTVTALIIILIVAAAIYAFGGDDSTQEVAQVEDEAAVTTEDAAMTGEDAMTEKAGDVAGDETAMMEEEKTESMEEAMMEKGTPEPVPAEELSAAKDALPEATTTEEGYVEVAEAGNGLTHLARKATTRYLNDRSAGYAVTNEHRIYIEDYIKDHMERAPLHVGNERTISFSLIEEAVASAGELNDSQLHNLTKYTTALK